MHTFRPAMIAGVCAVWLAPAVSAAPDNPAEMTPSHATLSLPSWKCHDRVTGRTDVGAGISLMVSAPHMILRPGLFAQPTAEAAKDKPDYDKKVCEQIDISLKLKRGLEFQFSQKGIVSGSWWPGTAVLHCDNPGTVDVTIRYIDTSGNKRVIRRSVRCSA